MPTTPMPSLDEQEPAYRCSGCRRLLFATELDRHVCFLCENRASKHLSALPDLYADLGHALQPGAGIRSVRISGGSKTPPLPVALHPLTLRGPGGIATKLQAVEDDWRRAAGRTMATFAGTMEQTVATTVTFLRINLQWACSSYEDVADDLDTISGLYWQAVNVLSGKQPRLIPVRCRLLYDDGNECGADLLVDLNRTSVKCSSCGTRWGSHEWMGLFEAVRQTAA